MKTETSLPPRVYDELWRNDQRREAAQHKANNRFPDHSAGNLPKADLKTLQTAAFIGVVLASAWVIWMVMK